MKNVALATLLMATGASVESEANAQGVPSTAIVSSQTSQCWDVKDYSSADGAVIQMYPCTGTANQEWVLQVYGFSGFDPLARIVNKLSGMCVSAESANPSEGAIGILQRACNSNDLLQQWQISAPFRQIAVDGRVVDMPVLTRRLTNVGNHWCMRTEDNFFRPVLGSTCSAPGDERSYYKMVGIR